MTMHHDNGTHEDYNTPGWVWLCTAILASLIFSVAINSGERADAAKPSKCDEAWQAPKSAKADQCRADGWSITRKYVVSPRKVMRMQDLRPCRAEDGNRRGHCGWNINARGERTGNGKGKAYIVTSEDFVIQLRVCFKGWDGTHCRDARARDFR